ncbi:MAG: polyprenyl synthetase family protein [Actinobacteria bacterium]|nr:polyprenyl synthetase family protein [Actinomycetota bacterium]
MRVKYPEETRELVEAGLERYFPAGKRPDILYEAMSHSLFSGGKRFRGILVIETAKTFGVSPKKALPTACAVEFIHTYSLIHDDLPAIDNDYLRRGQPTCHVLFGEDIAILAGDALFAEAFNLIAREQAADDPAGVLKVVAEIAGATGVCGMVGGQAVDVVSSGKQVDAETLEYIHHNKTGALIRASTVSGAILGGADEKSLRSITEYGVSLGLAFQVTDDILDVIGDPGLLGKTPGSDERAKKATYPGICGLERAQEFARERVEAAKASLSNLDSRTSVLRDLADFVFERQW